MSLTTFIKQPEIYAAFDRMVVMPRTLPFVNTVVPVRAKRNTLIGAAFDYLLRFKLERLFPDAHSRMWVAENALHTFDRFWGNGLETGQSIHLCFEILDTARERYERFLHTGRLTKALIRSTLLLAQLDAVYRSNSLIESFGTVHDEEVEDVRLLIESVPLNLFRPERLCILNPVFVGKTTQGIGGADADLLIDEMLVELKVVQEMRLDKAYIFQLLGYSILNELDGISDRNPFRKLPKSAISEFGIYYARHAYFHTFSRHDVINDPSWDALKEIFISRSLTLRPKGAKS